MDVLAYIKRLVIREQFRLTVKARFELECDGLSTDDLKESIVNARSIKKTIRSTSPQAKGREKLYVIEGATFSGTRIYSKGKIEQEEGESVFYVVISSKRSISW